MNYYGGIDIGSTSSEFVVINDNNEIISYCKELTEGNIQKARDAVFNKTLEALKIGIDDFNCIVSTGYGRKQVEFADKNVTEITCYAKGVSHFFPNAGTIVDIGGQDSKVISVGSDGSVKKFLMNDKCAAGTGRFLEMVSKTFNIALDDLGNMSLKSTEKIKISNICTVFAESEIISLFSKGTKTEDIIAAAHLSIGERIMSMLKRIRVKEEVIFCGGVASNAGMLKTLSELLGTEVKKPDDVFMMGAVGAALLAKE